MKLLLTRLGALMFFNCMGLLFAFRGPLWAAIASVLLYVIIGVSLIYDLRQEVQKSKEKLKKIDMEILNDRSRSRRRRKSARNSMVE